MEEGQNFTNHETGYTNVRGSHQISPHKPSKCERQNTGMSTEMQNKSLHVFNGVPQQKRIWIHFVNEHKRRDYGFKNFVQEGFSNGEITEIVSLDVEGAF